MPRMLKAGSLVLVEPVAEALRGSYPAANWMEGVDRIVKLAEDAPNKGTLDVIDCEHYEFGDVSIYDFQITKYKIPH